ncbi:aromatase/cyclase [Streptomyces capillispiralis]|uniref:Aromatase n=1 Tax=Streptomyces capillispiralis TaxID=68182 RepID=A0A561TPB6_9ACTN|nr:aromatase/cyclase [Streptomyces capillispiralis]TWF88961.1 aromatase [Streptomyces capillispiralis]GHH93230.1 actinorhodin polyketide synthase bifunctional cyclase/dehydratase [Streptomyces capillispiralis]
MPDSGVVRTRHAIDVAAEPEAVYELIAAAEDWPHVFPPTVHVERLDGNGRWERLRIRAFANGEVRSWTSRRELDPGVLRVTFRQEVSSAPVASMGGEWIIEAAPGGSSVVLLHDFTVVDDDPADRAWVERAVDTNSGSELAALKAVAESLAAEPGALLSFADHVDISGSGQEVYDFLWRADLWEERLPHVSRLVLTEPGDDLQTVEMDTRAADGSVHTTKSVRVGFAPDRLVYKQIQVPPLMAAHTGRWTVEPTEHGVRATSHHTVVLRPERVRELLGPEATLDTARDLVRQALGRNSRATLTLAKEAAERAVSL